MQVFNTTAEFEINGISHPNLPLLVDDSETPVAVVNRYLLWMIFEHGKANSAATWRNHADALCDYFNWLAANSTDDKPLRWDEQPRMTRSGEETSNLSLYQHWSQHDYRKPDGYPLEYSTINQRTACIEQFYKWARDKAMLINWLPYRVVLKNEPRSAHSDACSHTHGQQQVESSDLRLKEKRPLPKLINLEQCKALMAAPMSKTVKLMCALILGTGLRRDECQTFPRKYIFDPSGLDQRKRIRIVCDPKDMSLKGNSYAKERVIYVSWQLMAELYEYTQFGQGPERYQAYRNANGHEPTLLFLTPDGAPFCKEGLNNALRKLCKGWTDKRKVKHPPLLDFPVSPHKLRHTFATLELYHESEAKDPKTGRKKGLGHALAWVRDRLGHASIKNTTIYIHCQDLLDSHELNEYQREIDQMMVKGQPDGR